MLAAAAGAALVASEWLFFVTKPSMFAALGWGDRIGIFLSALLPAMLLPAALAAALAAALSKVRASVAATAAVAPAALLATSTGLLLVENFTKTVVGFNLADVTWMVRYLYLAVFLLCAALLTRRFARSISSPSGSALPVGLAVALIASLIAAGARFQPVPEWVPQVDRDAERPNIVILSTDGVEARRMSVYGYRKPTTPFLESRRSEFLIAENHFTNASRTAGANGALLTGLLPTTTGVADQFDVFSGRDVYRHLPGLLREIGYHGVQIGGRHYIDAYDQNLRYGFRWANGRELVADSLPGMAAYGRAFPSERYFLGVSVERVTQRLQHAAGLINLQDVLPEIVETQPWWASDRGRVDELLKHLESAPRPFLAFAHLLDTHGPRFRPARQVFTAGRTQSMRWQMPFLDDAVLGFDGYVEEVVSRLEAEGELERTILVITSDHGPRWSMQSRIPLLIRFPGGRPAGPVAANTQIVDLVPTLLEALGIEPPGRLEGESILSGELDRRRLVFATGPRKGGFIREISMVQCQNRFGLDLEAGAFESGTVRAHTAPCPLEELLDTQSAFERMVGSLKGLRALQPDLFLGAELTALRERRVPDLRKRFVEQVLGADSGVHRLDEDIVVVRTHSDLWTRGTEPAGIVVRNPTDSPVSRRIEVRSGGGRDFPVHVVIEDGETRRELVFERPGRKVLELGPVVGRSERLFILWTDSAWVGPGGRRHVGVRLAGAG